MAGCLPPVKSIHLEVSQPRSTIYFHCTICSASFAPLIAANYCFVRSFVRSFVCLLVRLWIIRLLQLSLGLSIHCTVRLLHSSIHCTWQQSVHFCVCVFSRWHWHCRWQLCGTSVVHAPQACNHLQILADWMAGWPTRRSLVPQK